MSLCKKNHFYLEHNQLHDINPKYLKKGGEKNLKFPHELHKDKSIKTLSPAIHLEWWDRRFEHEYMIKLSYLVLIN